ncbi:MAG: DNA-processing protein DprA [Myxococcaceae bacterium]
MANERDEQREREAVLGLWAIPGMGVVHLADLRQRAGGALGCLLDLPPGEWTSLLPVGLVPNLWGIPSLRELAAGVRHAAERAGIQIAFHDEEAYPELLIDLKDPPPVLFHFGPLGVKRRRVAMVGTRHPEGGFAPIARRLAYEVAEAGVGVVSGAALGIDTECHDGALAAGGETWAFVASGLDELDAHQAKMSRKILEGGGRVFTEYPPKVRAEKPHFPRRNRLIAGAADATLVLRAPRESGSLYTAGVARLLRRPLLALPGEITRDKAAGSNQLIHEGHARLCRGTFDVLEAVGIAVERTSRQKVAGRSLDELELSASAKKVYGALIQAPQVLEEVLDATGMDPAELSSALCELELEGMAVQHPGRLYEKV